MRLIQESNNVWSCENLGWHRCFIHSIHHYGNGIVPRECGIQKILLFAHKTMKVQRGKQVDPFIYIIFLSFFHFWRWGSLATLPRADLKLNNPSASGSSGLGLQACAVIPAFNSPFRRSVVLRVVLWQLTAEEHSHANVARFAFIKVNIEYLPRLQGPMYSFLHPF